MKQRCPTPKECSSFEACIGECQAKEPPEWRDGCCEVCDEPSKCLSGEVPCYLCGEFISGPAT